MTEPMRAPTALDAPVVSRVLTRVEFADGTGYEFEAVKPHGLDIKVDMPLLDRFGPVDPVCIPPGPVTSVRIEFKASRDFREPMMMRRLPQPIAGVPLIRLYECPLGHSEQRPEPECRASAVHCVCGEVMTEVSD